MLQLSVGYIAGFMDGEGTFTFLRRPAGGSYDIRVSAANCNTTVLTALKQQYGGGVYEKPRAQEHWARAYQWNLNGKQAAAFIEDVLPHLVIKHAVAAKVLELAQVEPLHRGRPAGWKPGMSYTCVCPKCTESRQNSERLAGEIKLLNARGSSPREALGLVH